MTFKGMLKILMTEYRKQHEAKVYSVFEELLRTRRELHDTREQLRILQLNNTTQSSMESRQTSVPMISLYVRYKEFFNQFYRIRQTMTVQDLLDKLRNLIKIPSDRSVRLCVLSEDGSTTICYLDQELHRTLQSYNECLKNGMILSIEDDDQDDDHSLQSAGTVSFEQIFSFNQSDV